MRCFHYKIFYLLIFAECCRGALELDEGTSTGLFCHVDVDIAVSEGGEEDVEDVVMVGSGVLGLGVDGDVGVKGFDLGIVAGYLAQKMVLSAIEEVEVEGRLPRGGFFGLRLVDDPFNLARQIFALDYQFEFIWDISHHAKIGNFGERAVDWLPRALEPDGESFFDDSSHIHRFFEYVDEGSPFLDPRDIVVGILGCLAEESVAFDNCFGLLLNSRSMFGDAGGQGDEEEEEEKRGFVG